MKSAKVTLDFILNRTEESATNRREESKAEDAERIVYTAEEIVRLVTRFLAA